MNSVSPVGLTDNVPHIDTTGATTSPLQGTTVSPNSAKALEVIKSTGQIFKEHWKETLIIGAIAGVVVGSIYAFNKISKLGEETFGGVKLLTPTKIP